MQRTKENLTTTMRELLLQWPLYEPDDHVQVTRLTGEDNWSLGYCGKFDGQAFTGGMRIAKEPPNLLEINLKGGVLYLLFIQLAREHRHKGYGDLLYKVVERMAVETGCDEVRQFPSGGTETTTREEYLVRRGWHPDANGEVFKPVSQILQLTET